MTDKEICQRAFLLILLSEIADVGIKNGAGIERITTLRKLCLESLKNKITGTEKEVRKLYRRCNRAVDKIFFTVMNHQTREVNTHKLIIALHPVALAMKGGGLLDSDVEEIMESFFEIESKQEETFDGKPITDKDWLMLKKSSEKVSEKICDIVKNI